MFRLLCMKAGERLTQLEAAEMLGVSPAAVAKSIPLLEKEGLVNVSREHGRVFIGFDRDGRMAVELKMTENLRMIFESGLVPVLEEKFPGAAIILFGSYAKGEDTTKSDIDIAVVGSREKEPQLESIEKQLGREIRLNFYSSFSDIKKELRENILSGILLAGRIEL